MPHLKCLPEDASLADLRAAAPELFGKLQPYGEELMRGPSPLSPGERELIAAYVSGLNSCTYCYGTHAKVAEAFGLSETLVAALVEDVETAPIRDSLRPLLRYAGKLTVTPSRMTPADAEAVHAAGWDDTALLHTIAVCAYFNNMNRLVEGAGITGTAASHAEGADRLARAGYLPPKG